MKFSNIMTKVISGLLVILMTAPYAYCADIGRVAYTEGRVDILRAGTDQGAPAIEGDLVYVGDSVRTKSNSKAEVTFKDKSSVRLAQNTKVDLKDYQLTEDNKRTTATILIERGKARTIISKMSDSAEFNINTPNAQGKVRGSDVIAFYQAGSSGMMVTEGKLSIFNPMHPESQLTIPAGSSVVVPQEELPKGPRPMLDIEKKMHEDDTFVPDKPVKRGNDAQIKGVISKMSGEVKVTKKGETAARPANLNDVLGEGDRINTGASGSIEIRLDNGNVINLKSDSDFLFITLAMDPKTGEYDNTFESSHGSVRARIEGLKGKSQFRVKTPTAISGARGTIMYLQISPASTKAFFEGGVGYMKNVISGLEKAIDVGQNAKTDDQGGLSDPAPTSDQERMEWSSGFESGSGVEGYSSPEGGAGLEFSISDEGGAEITGDLNTDTGDNKIDTDLRPIVPGDTQNGSGDTTVVEAQNSATGNISNTVQDIEGKLGDLGGIFALVGTFWNDAGAAGFLSVGDFLKDSEYSDRDFDKFIWQCDRENPVFSNDPETNTHMTFDGGAFYGFTAGIGGNFNDIEGLDGFAKFLYIDPDGKAGVAGGDLVGLFSKEFFDYVLLGEIERSKFLNGIDTGIGPDKLYDSIYDGQMGDAYLEGSSVRGIDEDFYSISGKDNFWTYSIVDYKDGVVQPWGIYQQIFHYGEFDGVLPGDWNAKMGGQDDTFGANTAYIHTYASYNYVDEAGSSKGYYSYEYFSNPVYGYIASTGYYDYQDSSKGFFEYYYPDGRKYRYSYGTGQYTWGTWDTSLPISQVVDNPPEGSHSLSYVESYKYGQYDRGFWIADIKGTSWNEGVLSATLSGRFMTLTKMGKLYGDILGVYDYEDYGNGPESYGWWQGVGAGEWYGDPLTLSGIWGDDYNDDYSIFENDEGYFNDVAEDFGYMGSLTESWWSKRAFTYSVMGECDLGSDRDMESGLLWDSPIQSYNGITDTDTALDGSYFTGYSTGTIINNKMKGDAAAIFIDPSGNAGLMEGGVSGEIYYAIDMWSADGVFQPVQQFVSLDLEETSASDYVRHDTNLDAYVYFESDYDSTYVEGWQDHGETQYVEGQGWGIYNLRIGDENSYTRPTASHTWGGNIYGSGEFGSGYRPTAGIMKGNVHGLYNDYTWYNEGDVEYADGYWIASSVGTFRSRAVSTEEEYSDLENKGAYYGYIGTVLTDEGLMIGKTVSIFIGSMSEDMDGEDIFDDDMFESQFNLLSGKGSSRDGGEINIDVNMFEGSMAGLYDMDWGIWAAKFRGYQNDANGLFAINLIGQFGEEDYFDGGGDAGNGLTDMWDALVSGIRVPGSDLLKGHVRGIMLTGGDGGYYGSLLKGDLLGWIDDSETMEAISIGEWQVMGEVDPGVVEEFGEGGFLGLLTEGSFSGNGKGSFDNGNAIDIVSVDGMTLNIRDQKWGIWAAFFEGICEQPGSIFNVAFGGATNNEDTWSNDRYMICSLRGYREGNELTAFLSGLGLGISDTDGSKIVAYSMTGNASGYIEVGEATTWKAAAAGEWVEVADLLDPSKLGFTAAGLADFVSVPITEVYSATNLVGTGAFEAGGAIRGAMDINLYASSSAVLSQVWTALISGTYNGATSSQWSLDLSTTQGDAAHLVGTAWSEGNWQADVQGTANGATFTGQAGGTYTPPDQSGAGTFNGAGAGTWQQPS